MVIRSAPCYASALLVMQSMIPSAYAARCTDYTSCREAVIAWCGGTHPKADRDKDGIPCGNVCKSLAQMNRIRREIGC